MTDQEAAVAKVLARHRQQHLPLSGDADCLCGKWRGPFTVTAGEGSHAAHVAAALLASDEFAEVLAGAMAEAVRERAIRAVHALEAVEVEPSVEQYVDAVLAEVDRADAAGGAR